MVWLRYAFLAVLAVLAVTLALANRAPVTLALWPDAVTALVGSGYTITLPLFVVVMIAVAFGLLLGFAWEWLRERGIRAEAARARRELEQLRARETPSVSPAAAPAAADPARDEILALVDGRKPAA